MSGGSVGVHDGHWVAASANEVFELAARAAEYLSSDHDVNNEHRGYRGISILHA